MKIFITFLMSISLLSASLLMSTAVSAQNMNVKSADDIQMLIAGINTGKTMPSHEAMEVFGLHTAGQKAAFASIVNSDLIDLTNPNHREVYFTTIQPAVEFIRQTETRTVADARRVGADLSVLKAHRLLAYEIVGAIGTQFSAAEVSSWVSVAEQSQNDLVDSILEDFPVDDSAGLQLRLDNAFTTVSVRPIPVDGGCFARFALPGDFDVNSDGGFAGNVYTNGSHGSANFSEVFVDLSATGNSNCRPDANDKECDQSDDALTSDTCDTAVDKYCRLVNVTGGGGVQKCTQSSDGAE